MLPATIGWRPATFRISPMSAVVVDLPFEPVMAMTVPCRMTRGELDLADDGNALLRRVLQQRNRQRHARTDDDRVTPSSSRHRRGRTRARRSHRRASTGSFGSFAESVSTTSSPRAARKFADATPDLPAPMTSVFIAV
jgi:hypothetical protein